MEHLQWFWGYAKKRVPKLAAGLVISLCVSMLGMVSPYVSGKIVGSIQDGTWEATLFASLAVIVGAAFARAVLRYIMLRVFERASQDLVLEMRNDTYAWIHRQNFSFFDSNRVGDIMARMTGDLDAIRHFVAYVIYGSVENLVIFIAAITLMFIVSWQLALLMLLTAPVIFASGFRQAKEIKPAFFQIREKFSRLNTVCEENIGGNRVVKAFTKEDQEIAKFTEANNEFYNSHINANSIWVKHLPILEFCAGILNVFLLCGGGILCALGRLQLWQLVAVNGYLWAVSNPLRQMGFLINDTQNFFASVDKIFGMVRKKIY
ncbi:MAG: ABC transporter ATP-binding protein, partial [Clostridiales bacterium]|nr:ABC transporter ATP-binding protein [Clostridiales bacterium]